MTDRKICEARCYLGTAIAALMNLFHLPDGRTLSDSDVIEILFLVVLTLIKGDIDKKKLTEDFSRSDAQLF